MLPNPTLHTAQGPSLQFYACRGLVNHSWCIEIGAPPPKLSLSCPVCVSATSILNPEEGMRRPGCTYIYLFICGNGGKIYSVHTKSHGRPTVHKRAISFTWEKKKRNVLCTFLQSFIQMAIDFSTLRIQSFTAELNTFMATFSAAQYPWTNESSIVHISTYQGGLGMWECI
jgi:hypothetical protein